VSIDGGQPRRVNAESLDAQRPRLIRFSVFSGVLALLTLSWVTWDLTHDNPAPAGVLISLVVLFGTTLIGAFLIARKRQRTIRSGQDERVSGESPSWLGPALAIIPGVVIVGSQVIGRSSAMANDLLGLIAAYGLTWFVGLTLGLVVTSD
jgi:hypothetical protein